MEKGLLERERTEICYFCVGLLLTDTMLVTTNNVTFVSLIQLAHPSSVSLCYTIIIHVHTVYMYVCAYVHLSIYVNIMCIHTVLYVCVLVYMHVKHMQVYMYVHVCCVCTHDN